MAKKGEDALQDLREKLKALSNRYAVELLEVLNPEAGNIIPDMGWDDIVEGILEMQGWPRPNRADKEERSQYEAEYEELRKRLSTRGTLYDSMQKLENAGFVRASGERGRKHRRYRITHSGRLALDAVKTIHGLIFTPTEVGKAARTLLRYKNFIRLMPAQAKFLREVGDVHGDLIIQMPPGSGKTFLAMVIVLMRLQQGIRCLYLAPYKSLSRQIVDEYEELFNQLGYSMVRYDAQSDASEQALEQADLVVGIYESVLSAVMAKKRWTEEIGLVIVDELTELGGVPSERTAHEIGEDRSSRLDLLIALLKGRRQIITLSSRFGDTDSVARWLNADVFRPSVRIVPDEFIVTNISNGVLIASADGTQQFTTSVRSRLDAIHEHIGDYSKRTLLVVTGTREAAEYYAARIADSYPREIDQQTIEYVIGESENHPAASRLRQFLSQGVAFHHAGLDLSLRARLERKIKEGKIECVVATTGITAGTSFPFDCVAIMLDQSLMKRIDRSRYLQIAGRIGEYHLAEHGGTVYLALPRADEGENPNAIASRLLHQPLQPLRPNPVDPRLVSAILAIGLSRGKTLTLDDMNDFIRSVIEKTLRAALDKEYADSVCQQATILVDWLTERGFIRSKRGLELSREAKTAIEVGINLLDLAEVWDLITMGKPPDEDRIIEILLRFDLVQAARPKSPLPLDIEIKMANVEPPDEGLLRRVEVRNAIKREVFRGWLEEKSVRECIESAMMAGAMLDEKRTRWSKFDEGDMMTMVEQAADITHIISEFLERNGMSAAAQCFALFETRLRWGLRQDAASTDLLRLMIPSETGVSQLTRREIRMLIDGGYTSIERIVRKDVDPSEAKPTRERFAKRCGLPRKRALEIYKAAQAHMRRARARR
ncbi:MAG: DEAD/DEAH box helicase [Candidatus Thorarchaeota archaeon]